MGLGAKMTDQERAVMQQALEALEIVLNNDYNLPYEKIVASVTAIRAALAEPVLKPATLKRGLSGQCTRKVCECEKEGFGLECIHLEPMIDGYPLWSGMPKAPEQAHHDLLTTHSAECWRWHHECAIAEVERLRAFAVHSEQAKEAEKAAYAAGWYQSMQAQAKDGCAHCLHPLYCGIKCGVCGRSS